MPISAVPCILLTGATGLVGRFLLRRLLQAEHEVAVVIRPGPMGGDGAEGAQRRLEQALQPLESSSLLRRPRVIAWDLTDGPEKLRSESIEWFKGRPTVVVHCAASIRFQKDSTTGEPYQTNVHGTENLLKVCQRLNVLAFHHVSTAYVGPHRDSGIVFEGPINHPSNGNDYEQSKVAAEQLVTASQHIGRVTLHRPSIVVGDSQSGYTSTFHGFYTPLHIGWQYAKQFGFSQQAGEWFRSHLGLLPEDQKNLVTVDWVVECIARTIELDQTNGSDYTNLTQEIANDPPRVLHWTHPKPVACRTLQSAIVDAIENASLTSAPELSSRDSTKNPTTNLDHQESMSPELPSADEFRKQMQAYESYFQSDPKFDTSESQKVSIDIRCPVVDDDLLRRLADWAIAANFGWPKFGLPPLPHRELVGRLLSFPILNDGSTATVVQLRLLGPGSPETLCFGRARSIWYQLPSSVAPSRSWQVSLENLALCCRDASTLEPMIRQGFWLIEGPNDSNCNETGIDLACDWLTNLCYR